MNGDMHETWSLQWGRQNVRECLVIVSKYGRILFYARRGRVRHLFVQGIAPHPVGALNLRHLQVKNRDDQVTFQVLCFVSFRANDVLGTSLVKEGGTMWIDTEKSDSLSSKQKDHVC